MLFVYHRCCHWMRTRFLWWRRQRTMVFSGPSGQRMSRRWLVLLITLSLIGGIMQWQIGADQARPLEIGLSLPEQAFADAVTTSPARTDPEAEARHPASDVVPATNTVPSSDPVAPVTVPVLPVTESATPIATPQACLRAPLQAVASDVSPDATLMPRAAVVATGAHRRRTTRGRPPRRTVARLLPPRGITVVAIASRSALLRLSQGPLVTVRSGTIVQGWMVRRFSPSGIALTHADQQTRLSVSPELGHVR
jgi:hypothetical protein